MIWRAGNILSILLILSKFGFIFTEDVGPSGPVIFWIWLFIVSAAPFVVEALASCLRRTKSLKASLQTFFSKNHSPWFFGALGLGADLVSELTHPSYKR